MFDLGFTEILVIFVVALVVLGPERLPEVARAVGRFIAKAQGYVTQVKSEFNRETQLSEIQRLREEIATSANALKSSVSDVQKTLTQEVNSVNASLNDVRKEVDQLESENSPYTQFNQSEATFTEPEKASQSGAAVSDFRKNNPFGWDLGDDEPASSYHSMYVPKRYKPTASLDDVIEELEEIRRELALPRKSLGGYNRRYAPRSRVNRPRIYR